jgi:hypothetical protein
MKLSSQEIKHSLYSPIQKLKFVFLFLFLGGAFFFSFKQRVGTFFTKHPAYKKLLDHQSQTSAQKVSNVFKKNYPHTAEVVRDLEKINLKRKFFDESELEHVKDLVVQLRSPSSLENKKLVDPFKSFRGTWKGEDNSLLISKDRVIDSENKKAKLQYLEFRNPNGTSAYGLNSSFYNAKMIFSKVVDGKLNSLFDRIGMVINQQKIIWLTKRDGQGDKQSYRISIDHVMDGLLNVKSVDVDFKLDKGKIEKVNFSSHQFSRLGSN